MKKNNFLFLFFAATIGGLLAGAPAIAICPLCTVAVASGVGLSRYLGIDDTITALWIGGLTISLIFWTADWLKRKKIKFFAQNLIVAIFYIALVMAPLYLKDIIGHPLNTLWGVDKIILGLICGFGLFFLGHISYLYLKNKNNGRAHFPYQKIVMSVTPLILASVIFYFIT